MSGINHFMESRQSCVVNIKLLNDDPLIICITPFQVVVQKSLLSKIGF